LKRGDERSYGTIDRSRHGGLDEQLPFIEGSNVVGNSPHLVGLPLKNVRLGSDVGANKPWIKAPSKATFDETCGREMDRSKL
jgi:hypothetical protein